MSRHFRHRPAGTRQHGAVAVAFILMIVLLLGFVGLVVDSARLFVSKTELQNAADSCALAAAASLTGANTEQLTQAENWGITAGTRNLVGMQASAVAIPVNSAVAFSRTLNGSYATKDAISGAEALEMKFARCRVIEAGIPSALIQVLNALPGVSIGPGTARAEAVATLAPSVSNCALPLAVCKKKDSSPPHFGYERGEWMQGRWSPGSETTGTYKWVKFPGYANTPDLDALIKGSGQCDLNNTSTVRTHEGQINSLVDAWNWRFGVHKNSGQTSPPDLTGYAYTKSNWLSERDAFDDFKARRGTNDPWNNQPSLSGGWNASTRAQHQAGGDRRLVVGPIVDCEVLSKVSPQTDVPILAWACYLMLNPVANPTNDWMGLEYRGSSLDPIPERFNCVTSGLPGGPTAGGPKVPTLVQ
ncbi:pilus assembly protein TadG-related protein [Quisquiliibacterium transsilvanicum]|uniref:Flp pilus assembly protein TadG n=1 Tax=Quisquiliibacterium transsilvanicum TaxID=1549638 RepID=A0A7W8HFT1_9BURK|nr:Tad domain-containing protein [Quisquiliibacterium transsilvanicum]MBB5271057.1 Flp pilus assembly protein TadG [Quisquiliibacterium transsilvanicum]